MHSRVYDTTSEHVLSLTFCQRCHAPLRYCAVCTAHDWYPLRCDCPHECHAPAGAVLVRALSDLRTLAQEQRRLDRIRAYKRTDAGRKAASGRCVRCGWSVADATIYRAGLCRTHYERRLAWVAQRKRTLQLYGGLGRCSDGH